MRSSLLAILPALAVALLPEVPAPLVRPHGPAGGADGVVARRPLGPGAPQVTCPSLHHFGTADDYLDMEAVGAITRAVTAEGRPAQVELHEGANHAFDNDDFMFYDAALATLAWERTLSFLAERLQHA